MCNASGIDFVCGELHASDVAGRRVLEVGSMDVNGSVRPYIESLKPATYIGVDMADGPGVDEVCDVRDLLTRFGPSSFDIVVSTEMLEHVENWRQVMSILKRVVCEGGLLIITTRSAGFPYHGYPFDFWRYEVDDMQRIFAQCDDLAVSSDPISPGVFVRARRPQTNWETGYDDLRLRSIITGKRSEGHTQLQILVFRFRKRIEFAVKALLPASAKRRARELLGRS